MLLMVTKIETQSKGETATTFVQFTVIKFL